jgi:hypothetical protein
MYADRAWNRTACNALFCYTNNFANSSRAYACHRQYMHESGCTDPGRITESADAQSILTEYIYRGWL